MKHKDKVVIVTGAAQGLGLACAERFINEGAKVLMVDRQEEKLKKEIDRLGTNARAYVSDLVNYTEKKAAELVAVAVDHFGAVDVLVNNAGILRTAEFVEFPEAMFDETLNINLRTPFLIGQAVARQMIKQGRGGYVVNMSSVNSELAIPTAVAYAVTKGGMKQLTAVMAVSLAKHNIRVNAIGPGTILTDLVRETTMTNAASRNAILARTPIGRLGDPAEVASVASFLASEDASYILGQTIFVDGGRMIVNYLVPVDD